MPMRIEALDYNGMIEALCTDPTMEPWELGEVICQTYYDHNPTPATEMYALINCSCLPALVTKLNAVGTILNSYSTSNLEYLSEIRENMYYDNYHRRLDIQSMIDEIRFGFPGHTSLLTALDELETEYHKTVMYSIHGKYAQDASGLGIFFPRDLSKVLNWAEYIGLETGTDLDGLDFLADSTWDEFLITYLDVADNITYTTYVYQDIVVNGIYDVEAERDILNVYGLYIYEAGIYNITLSSIVNDLDVSCDNGNPDEEIVIVSDFVWSSYVNPEESIDEHISYWFDVGFVLIFVGCDTETANGTLHIQKSNPKPIQLGQVATGQFPYALGYIPPATVYNFYSVDLAEGNYEIEIDIEWPVGLEVLIIDEQNEFILTQFQGIPGLDFNYNLSITESQTITIGFLPHTGTGNFTFTIKNLNSTGLFIIPIIIIPASFVFILIIIKKYKK
jgi:hypothetical protein